MRIVNRRTFLAVPRGTLFRKYSEKCGFGELEIFCDSLTTDYVTSYLDSDFRGAMTGLDIENICQDMLNGEESPPMTFRTARDALYDYDQLYAVYSLEDQEALVNHLQSALALRKAETEKGTP
jgi:hypothetical protein